MGVAILVLLIAVAALAPVLTPFDPQRSVGIPHQSPSITHLLGTNDLGQDILTRLLHGTRLSLTIGILAGLTATAVGLAAGLSAGYFGGWKDAAIMRVVDLTLGLPFIPLVIVLAAFFGRSLLITIGVIAVVLWARPARILRSQTLKIAAYQHVDAARAMGSSSSRTIWRHVLPRTAPLAAAQFVHAANVAVLIEASLSFLGLGDPNRVSWGTMLFFANSSNAILTQEWLWWVLPTGLTLTAAVVSFAFIGVALEQWGDRRLVAGTPAASVAMTRTRRARRPVLDGDDRGAGEPANALTVERLRVAYHTPAGPLVAVDDVSFSVAPNRLVGLAGESGCGKTTLAMALMGLLPGQGRLEGGTIRIGAEELTAPDSPGWARVRGRQVSLIPQSSMNALNPAYTAHRQIAEAAALTRSRETAGACADEFLERVGLTTDNGQAYPHQLSGGMRQRVVIAMGLVNHPRLVIADEPLTGLDVVTQKAVIELLLQLQSTMGMAVLLVSHDLPLIGHVTDDILVMYAGKIVEAGPSATVMQQPAHPYTQELLRAFPTLHGRRGHLATLPGEPPDLRDPPDGCRFHPRCPRAFDECDTTVPPSRERVPGHHASCLLDL